jgi:hypothetical protein
MLHVQPLLGKGLVNTFPQKQTRGTIGRLLLGNEAVITASLKIEDGVFRGVFAEELSWRQAVLQVQLLVEDSHWKFVDEKEL